MKNQRTQDKSQGSLIPVTIRPAVESLVRLDTLSPWNEKILKDTQLKKFSQRREDLISKLDRLYNLVPRADMDFGVAANLRLINELELAEFYKTLTQFLEEEEYSERLLLYFPTELLPGKTWGLLPDELQRAVESFKEVFVRKWYSLLSQHDLRANFVDGDIPEVEIRNEPLPTVVKATHLIPTLIQKGILSYQDVLEIRRGTNDNVLKADLKEIMFMFSQSVLPKEKASTTFRNAEWLESQITKTLTTVEKAKEHQSSKSLGKTAARLKWEIHRDEQQLIDECATEISETLINGTLHKDEFRWFINQSQNKKAILVGIVSARKTIEEIVRTDPKRAREIYLAIKPVMDRLWQEADEEVRNILESTWSRLATVGIACQNHPDKIGIKTPQFDQDVLARIEEIPVVFSRLSEAIEASAELSKFLFPITIAYGSRVKGYSTQDADVDIAVFVRPNVQICLRGHIQNLLSELFEQFEVKSKALEFWTEEAGSKMRIRDFVNPDTALGDSTLVYILFGGVWVGNKNSIRDLYEKVLEEYLHSKDKMILNEPARELWLKEMERNALQYRLMHKGYHHFYPEQKTANLPERMIDSKGAFWDSGFRRVATKLFLKKVFLPYISRR